MSFSLLLDTLQLLFIPSNLLLIACGMILGVFFGALPGISSSMGIVLMIPFTYQMGIIPSIILLSALYAGSAYGGSITAILFNTPGTPEAVATTFDGYPMAQQGKAGKALGLAMTASAAGGIFSALVMVLLAPSLSKVALKIQSAEYFALTLLGIACIASVGSKSLVKAIIPGCIGILIALIGLDPITGVSRMTFGSINLLNGVEFIPIMIGAFAISEVLKQVSEREVSTGLKSEGKVSMDLVSFKEFFHYKWTVLKSAVIGTAIGILPGTGGSIASVVSYGEAYRSARDKTRFGNGAEEGVIAPEAANNAAAGGAMIPSLVLGIPGSPTTAIILAALILQGLQPGPQLMREQPLMLYAIFFAMLLTSTIIFLGGRIAVAAFTWVLKLPYRFLAPIIILFSVLGSYAVANDLHQIWIMLSFGLFGYFMKKYEFSSATLVLGLVLGKLMEENFRRQLLLTKGDYLSFFTRPITLVIFLFIAFILVYPFVRKLLKNRRR